MTAYAVSASVAQNGGNLSYTTAFNVVLSPSAFEIRILSIQYAVTDVEQFGGSYSALGTAGITPRVTRYSSGTASGGSSASVSALRHGSPSASATARTGTGASVSGGTVAYDGALPALYATQGGSSNYSFAADFTVSPGSNVLITGGPVRLRSPDVNTSSIQVTVRLDIQFEELRLSWPY